MGLTSGNSNNNHPVAETKPLELQTTDPRGQEREGPSKEGCAVAKRPWAATPNTLHKASIQLKGRLMEAVIRKFPKNYNTCLQHLTDAVHKLMLFLY